MSSCSISRAHKPSKASRTMTISLTRCASQLAHNSEPVGNALDQAALRQCLDGLADMDT